MRWKLATSHYLNVVENWEWEYSEVNRKTGRPTRYRRTVPRLLDVKDPGDWTSKWGTATTEAIVGYEEGEIIVCWEGQGHATDVAFIGDPTPDMIPVDDEARAVSATFAERWSYQPSEGQEGDYSRALVDKLDEAMSKVNTPKPVEIPGMADLIAVLTAQSQMIGQLVAAQAASKPLTPSSILNRGV